MTLKQYFFLCFLAAALGTLLAAVLPERSTTQPANVLRLGASDFALVSP